MRLRIPSIRGISLANKCLLLFGGAVVLIVLAGLTAPWLRMRGLVHAAQLEQSRQLALVWENLDAEARAARPLTESHPDRAAYAGIEARRYTPQQAAAADDRFIRSAMRTLQAKPALDDVQRSQWSGAAIAYRYAKAVRDDDSGAVLGLVTFDRRSPSAAWFLAVNTVYLLQAAALVLILATVVFYFITHKLILSPVHDLMAAADRVRHGDLSTRAQIATGDEFEELAGAFNAMLVNLQRTQADLRAINTSLDVKLTELSQANQALYDAARLKGEFLANVSHELRTPMNSVIGFAELLMEIAHAEAAAGDDSTRLQKRIKYLDNILNAARGLLDLINGLLEMAKIEAGRIDVRPEPMNLRDACTALLALIQPLADRKKLELRLEAADDLPEIETDPKKFQQVVFNFLSNAVKFTDNPAPDGSPGRVVLRAESLRAGGAADEPARVRVSVIDNGPGIDPADRQRIFEKFEQGEGAHTRARAGTGLGLAIARELAAILQGEIQLESELGRGSMFSLILPVRLNRERAAELKLEAAFRGSLAGRRAV